MQLNHTVDQTLLPIQLIKLFFFVQLTKHFSSCSWPNTFPHAIVQNVHHVNMNMISSKYLLSKEWIRICNVGNPTIWPLNQKTTHIVQQSCSTVGFEVFEVVLQKKNTNFTVTTLLCVPVPAGFVLILHTNNTKEQQISIYTVPVGFVVVLHVVERLQDDSSRLTAFGHLL